MKKISIVLALLMICSAGLFAKSEGTVLQNNATLWQKGDDGVMAWGKDSASVAAGTLLEFEVDVVSAPLKTSTKTYDSVDFYNVIYEGKSLYIQANRFSPGNAVSVITKNSTLYSKPAVNTFRNAYIEPGTFVVYYGSYDSPLCTFAKIEFFDEDAYTIRTRYVQKKNVSDSKADVKAIQIINKLAEAKDEKIRQELINSAAGLSTSDGIKAIVDEEYNKIFPSTDENP